MVSSAGHAANRTWSWRGRSHCHDRTLGTTYRGTDDETLRTNNRAAWDTVWRLARGAGCRGRRASYGSRCPVDSAHYEGSYNNAWGLPGNSRLTPLDGAKSMGVQNLILIRYEGKPEPPYDAYAAPLGSLKKLMWSITGAGGTTSDKDRDQVFALAAKMPNLTGVFMDDFFRDLGSPPAGLAENNMLVQAALSVENLRQLRQRLTVNGRKLDLGVTLYTYQLHKRIIPHLKQCDIVSLWTWEAADLARLEENFAKCQMLMPGKRILLGLYMYLARRDRCRST